MPLPLKLVLMLPYHRENLADFRERQPIIERQRHGPKPYLRRVFRPTNVYVGRLVPLIAVKVEAVALPAINCRHFTIRPERSRPHKEPGTTASRSTAARPVPQASMPAFVSPNPADTQPWPASLMPSSAPDRPETCRRRGVSARRAKARPMSKHKSALSLRHRNAVRWKPAAESPQHGARRLPLRAMPRPANPATDAAVGPVRQAGITAGNPCKPRGAAPTKLLHRTAVVQAVRGFEAQRAEEPR